VLYSAAFLKQLQRAAGAFLRQNDGQALYYAERVELYVPLPMPGVRGQVATQRVLRAAFRPTARRMAFQVIPGRLGGRLPRGPFLRVVLWPRAGLLPADPIAAGIPTAIGRSTRVLTFHSTPL
jgi:hypothetical protein